MFKKKLTGYTKKTQDHIVLGAGVFIKNFDIETDTFETAVQAGKLIGATKGGGEFSATPNYLSLEIDDMPENTKGNRIISDWSVSIKANTLEVTPENIKLALGPTVAEQFKNYSKITGKTCLIDDEDYLDNITWIGVELGTDDPMIIQVKNALSVEGLTITPESKGSLVIALSFSGNYEPDSIEPPYNIYVPIIKSVKKPVANPGGGEYQAPVSVSLAAIGGADIFYSIDGTTPTKSSTKYTSAIEINATKTLKAIAVLNDEVSSILEEKYTITV